MNQEDFRVIPGYDSYGVNEFGVVVSFERNIVLSFNILNGYFTVDTFRGSLTETLPVHRAVALAWVENLDPINYCVVNHKDGNTINNWKGNLEWTTYSGNNYHAINSGLRSDNIRCKIRDFYTKEIIYFESMAQAAEFMGLGKDTPVERLYPKMFGKLVAGRYEFRYASDATPWFYEERTELVPPSRYMVIVEEPNGITKEIYSNSELLQSYQLYSSASKSIPALAEHANTLYPDKKFLVRDSYSEVRFREERKTQESTPISIRAKCECQELEFESLTKCARYFNVDRSSIINRLDNDKKLDGWTFTQIASLVSNG